VGDSGAGRLDASVRQQDYVELVGGFVSIALFGAMMGTLGRHYGWPRGIGLIVSSGIAGFAGQQIWRRIKAGDVPVAVEI
jgi:hypothetical protein